MTISVFGNPTEPQDSLAVRIVPQLESRFKNVAFRLEDPTESLEPVGNPWVILDVAIGIDSVTVITDLDDLEQVKGQSVHDFDVYMELRLRKKLGQLPEIKIILLPNNWNDSKALEGVYAAIQKLFSA